MFNYYVFIFFKCFSLPIRETILIIYFNDFACRLLELMFLVLIVQDDSLLGLLASRAVRFDPFIGTSTTFK